MLDWLPGTSATGSYCWFSTIIGSPHAARRAGTMHAHEATTVASVREESGRVIARNVLPTDGAAITEFVRE